MAVAAIMARDWTFKWNDTTIEGINTWTPSDEESEADVTTFSSNGNKMHLITSRGKSATFEGVYLEGDGPDTARDPGQEAVETSAALMGTAAYGQLTITSPGGTVKVRNGTVKLTDAGGGGNDDQSKWGFEFKRSGADV